jgi:hypothetical protein
MLFLFNSYIILLNRVDQAVSVDLYSGGEQINSQSRLRLMCSLSLFRDKCRDCALNYAMNASFHIFSSSLFTIIQSINGIYSYSLVASLPKFQYIWSSGL